MRLGSLFWKLFLGNALLMVVVLGACAWLMARELDHFQRDDLTTHLRSQASLIRYAVEDRFLKQHGEDLERLVHQLQDASDGNVRVTLILPSGDVLADSEANPGEMESHANRSEVRQALSEGWGSDVRFSRTVQREMKYVGLRIGPAENPIGVVRVSMAIRTIGQRSGVLQRIVWTTTLLGVVAAVLFAMVLARLWSNPIHRITAIAHSLSRGDLNARAPVRGNDEIGLLARSLNEMRDHLAHTILVKTDFASNASHELRTPLSAIRAAVETLLDLDPARDPASMKHLLDVVERQSKRMEDMVSDLLHLSRIESAAAPPEPERLDLCRLLDELHQQFQERLTEKAIAWNVQRPDDLTEMTANPYLLRIALDNLVDNAIKFTDPGGRIEVVCERTILNRMKKTVQVPAIAIRVADTGCGIPEHEQDRVFERFYQVGKSRSGPQRGTGLGLSIVRHAVRAMNGKVKLKSAVGQGTQVRITIPQQVIDPSSSGQSYGGG